MSSLKRAALLINKTIIKPNFVKKIYIGKQWMKWEKGLLTDAFNLSILLFYNFCLCFFDQGQETSFVMPVSVKKQKLFYLVLRSTVNIVPTSWTIFEKILTLKVTWKLFSNLSSWLACLLASLQTIQFENYELSFKDLFWTFNLDTLC